MKRQSLFITILLMLVLLSTVTPVTAAGNEPIGDRIGVFYGGSMEFPANTPFNIRHGFILTSEADAIGVYDFKLEVDGVLLRDDFKMFSVTSGDPDTLTRLWLYNFPNGMTGIHAFTGHWFEPCYSALASGVYPGPCVTPNARVETRTQTLTVTFTP